MNETLFFIDMFVDYHEQVDFIIELIHKIYKIPREELQILVYELLYEILYEKNSIDIDDFLMLDTENKNDLILQFCRRVVECFKHKINGQKEDELYLEIIQYLIALGVYHYGRK